jgi:hypothetical protein
MRWDLATLGILTAVLLIGYIIGLLEAGIKQNIKDKKKNQNKEKPETLAAPVRQANLLSINRDPSNSLIVEVDGQILQRKEDLSGESRAKLIKLLVEMRPWLEATPNATAKPVKGIQPGTTPPHPLVPRSTASTSPIAETQAAPVTPPESIVSQIDAILQICLASSHLAGQGIRLVESSEGGVNVFVGLNKYGGIDAVPDPEIQAIIRQAVAEWEGQT